MPLPPALGDNVGANVSVCPFCLGLGVGGVWAVRLLLPLPAVELYCLAKLLSGSKFSGGSGMNSVLNGSLTFWVSRQLVDAGNK